MISSLILTYHTLCMLLLNKDIKTGNVHSDLEHQSQGQSCDWKPGITSDPGKVLLILIKTERKNKDRVKD